MRHSHSAMLAALVFTAACGSDSNPAAPTTTPPVVAPPAAPPPPARATFTLDAPSDHFQYSNNLGALAPLDALDIEVRPLRVNTVSGESFAHSIGFWVFAVADRDGGDSNTDGFAMILAWTQDSEWQVVSRIPGAGFQRLSTRLQLPMGDQRPFRVIRRNDGGFEFVVNGASVLGLDYPAKSAFVFAQVVGAAAEFTYLRPVSGTSTRGSSVWMAPPGPCIVCPPRALLLR